MADRYWVGGLGKWNAVDTTNWSASSGGPGGASVPTSSDNVYIDSNSGLTQIEIDEVAVDAYDLYITNPSNTGFFGTKNINCYGTAFVTPATLLTSNYTGYVNFYNSNCTLSGSSVLRNINLQDGVTLNSEVIASTGYTENVTINNSGRLLVKQNLKVAKITCSTTSGVRQVLVGTSSTPNIALTVVGTYPAIQGRLSIESINGGKLVMDGMLGTSGLSTTQASFANIEINPVASGRVFRFGGSCSITNLSRASGSLSFTLQVTPTAALDVTNFSVSGDVGTTIKVESSVFGVRAKINKLSGGLVETNYIQVTDMQPTPDNTWISYNSIDGGNNWQWYFNNFNKPTSCLFFGSHV